jgi:hypothetical protein
MNGDPSRRLVCGEQGRTKRDCKSCLLIQEDFAVVLSFTSSCSKTIYTIAVRFRTLEKAAVATNRVINAILSRAMEFWVQISDRSLCGRNG